MFKTLFGRQSLLTMKVNGEILTEIFKRDLPCEKTPSKLLAADSNLEFMDDQGRSFAFGLGANAGWFHFSVRVRPNLACQADCVITDQEKMDPEAFSKGANAIRFQPFFISDAKAINDELVGRGLFQRGLHFAGTITPSNISLDCLCDHCRKSFLIKSFHNGFGNTGHFYSGSGRYTLILSSYIPGAPSALTKPDADQLAALEARLPNAPDGTTFRYNNSFRCPHCAMPYIDFEKYPADREAEYYGNYLVGTEPLQYSE